MIINFRHMTDNAIAKEIGQRAQAIRLQRNITQKELARRTTLSLKTIQSIESGSGKLNTLIAVLRELKALDHLEQFLPPIGPDPITMAKMQGKKRQRASGGND